MRDVPAVHVPGLVAPSPLAGVRAAVATWPERTALELAGRAWTYAELWRDAGRIATAIRTNARSDAPFVTILASRSSTAYLGSLAIFGAGRAHVALNPAHPPARTARVLALAGADVLLVDRDSEGALLALLHATPADARPRTVIAPESNADLVRGAFPDVHVVGAGEIGDMDAAMDAPEPPASALAYLVFTSGSTGEPKGIAIDHGALATYMRNFRALMAPTPDDRLATTYELTFDIALHDMLQAWWSGAALCVVPARALAAPAHFIRNNRITWWFSVASVAMLLERQGVLRPGVFSSLKVSLLCGEPLPVRSAAAWAAAAPSSTLHNVYGPTETTMELAFHRFDPAEASRRGVVAIGIPFADHAHVLLDDAGAEVVGEGQGELYVSGPQLAVGYWKDPDRTARAFVTLPARSGRWYRTGDLVERDACGVYHFVSRVDFQVKLRGHRIELGEVEAALREAVGSDLAVVIPHPFDGANAQGLVAFAVGEPRADGELRAALAAHLPASMIPDRFVWLDTLPLNANRKVDRGALADRLTRGA